MICNVYNEVFITKLEAKERSRLTRKDEDREEENVFKNALTREEKDAFRREMYRAYHILRGLAEHDDAFSKAKDIDDAIAKFIKFG